MNIIELINHPKTLEQLQKDFDVILQDANYFKVDLDIFQTVILLEILKELRKDKKPVGRPRKL